MDIVSLIPFALALAIAAGTPGPSIAALVSRVLTNGWRDVAPFLAAMWVGEILWLTLSMAGMTALAETFHTAFQVAKWIGIAYLLWLAWHMWFAPANQQEAAIPKRKSAFSMFTAGMALTLGNPKIMVFYLALLPSLVHVAEFQLSVWAVVATTTCVVLMCVDLLWVLVASQARKLLRKPGAMRIANRVSASAMGGAAAVMASRN